REHADDLAGVVHRRPAAVAPRRRRVRLDHGLIRAILLEARDGATGDRRFHLGRRVQQLVTQPDAGKADDVQAVAEPCLRGAGETPCPLVTSQPAEATNQPVPVSRKGGGVTVVSAPAPQRTVTSPPTSETTSATAGFARSNAS